MLARQPPVAREDPLADLVALADPEPRSVIVARLDEDDSDRHLTGHPPACRFIEKTLAQLLYQLVRKPRQEVAIPRSEPLREPGQVVGEGRVVVVIGEPALEVGELISAERLGCRVLVFALLRESLSRAALVLRDEELEV